MILRPLVSGLLIFSVMGAGCTLQVPVQQTTAASQSTPAHPLPFKGKLVSGNVNQLPPAVAMSLSADSPVSCAYREELSHNEYHIPLVVSAFDPVTYIGAPLGDYGVTAFASLSIYQGNTVLGDYTAKAFVTRSYSLYSEPTHQELEQAARAAVRYKIDQKLYNDETRLAQAAAGGQGSGGGAP